jgi:hypothetical protein
MIGGGCTLRATRWVVSGVKTLEQHAPNSSVSRHSGVLQREDNRTLTG